MVFEFLIIFFYPVFFDFAFHYFQWPTILNWFTFYKQNEEYTITETEIKDDSLVKINKFDKQYESKYMEEYKNTSKTYVFTSDELLLINDTVEELKLKNTDNKDLVELLKEAEQVAVNKKVEDLYNSYIFELTPLGNVIMRYNSKSETFDYFSDNAIPYRILETISRKYVLRNNCVPLYVDMEQSLKESEEKAREREKEIKEKELEKEKSSIKTKNIFASFKSYNKQSISNNIQNIPPPRNGSNVRVENKDTIIVIKEEANRYSHQGKMVNFNFLKKIDKKIVNKKLALSFADFKAMNIK
uniref:Uncharacterized protein n=1 Tax=viral metagenome TaxID=1070528 RepID=A0A6C0LL93_9ZZZZ